MIHLKITPKGWTEHERKMDPLHRPWHGYEEGMGVYTLFDIARGTWHLDPERARKERYALVSVENKIRQVFEVFAVDPVEVPDRPAGWRYVFDGKPLPEGHPIAQAYLGQDAPDRSRTPVTYHDMPEDKTPCRCGCGNPVPAAGKDFITGHDQTALHERVKQIGSVKEFIDWFDSAHGYWPDVNVITAQSGAPKMRHRLGCSHLSWTDPSELRTAAKEEMALPVCSTCRDAPTR